MELHVLQPSTPNDSPRLWAAGSFFPRDGKSHPALAHGWQARGRGAGFYENQRHIFFEVYPPGNDHISDQTGKPENHRLKSAG